MFCYHKFKIQNQIQIHRYKYKYALGNCPNKPSCPATGHVLPLVYTRTASCFENLSLIYTVFAFVFIAVNDLCVKPFGINGSRSMFRHQCTWAGRLHVFAPKYSWQTRPSNEMMIAISLPPPPYHRSRAEFKSAYNATWLCAVTSKKLRLQICTIFKCQSSSMSRGQSNSISV